MKHLKKFNEAILSFKNEYEFEKFKSDLEVWNYVNDKLLDESPYDSVMEMPEEEQDIHAHLVSLALDKFKKGEADTINSINKMLYINKDALANKETNKETLEEPSAVQAEDEWPFVRLSNGTYTDGDQIYNSYQELKEVSDKEGLDIKPMSKYRESEVRNRDIIKEMDSEIE